MRCIICAMQCVCCWSLDSMGTGPEAESRAAWPLQVGWKHQDAVKELEEKRKVRSAAYYEQKKKLNSLKLKAAADA